MLGIIGGGLLGRVVGLGLFVGGFWALVRGFVDSSIPVGILGGALIPLGMWVLVQVRKGRPTQQ